MLEVHSAAESEEKIQFDDDLVVLAKFGDHTAFVELIRRHRLMSFKLAYSILRDRARTEDELQNATLKAFAHLEQFQGDAKFSTWLASIVVNQCLMCLRRDKRAKILYLDDFQLGEEMGTFDLRDHTDTPETDLRRRQLSQLVRHEVKQMPFVLRSVIWMRDIQERSMREVAAELGISLSAAAKVKCILKQARRLRFSNSWFNMLAS